MRKPVIQEGPETTDHGSAPNARIILRALSAIVTLTAVAVTLATSPSHSGMDGMMFRSTEPFQEEVWRGTMVMDADEASIHMNLTLPTGLMNLYEPTLHLHWDLAIDNTQELSSTANASEWTLSLGDDGQIVQSFSAGPLTPHDDDFSVFGSQEAGSLPPLPISESCQPLAWCLPCDLSQSRCDTVLVLDRSSMALPRVRIELVGEMIQLAPDPSELEIPSSARRRF